MTQSRKSFRHESLQDADSIQEMLDAIARGLAKGKLSFSDDDGQVQLKPSGLLNFRVSATEEEGEHRLSLRISWQPDGQQIEHKPLQVK
ncbi:amphi-Trp domain-containing protein [Parahaliea maris]|uniref:Amphi-Trp domain-containing protein n=1 Tax=Parahaliea maris TaxID=2716870 RepID=A0A5C9A7Y3_9GAMM|nr:amphi-Trp domain-containing protein [Parahaliea maris]TXS95780.1 amphi-Trp domain-containing protein [Parahaliea maris]